MSFLDGLFVRTVAAELAIAEASITASGEIEAGFLYPIEGSDDDIELTLDATLADARGKRLAIKVSEAAPSPPGGSLTVIVPDNMLIEGDGGALASEFELPTQAVGSYREWICDAEGNWLMVAGAANVPTHAGMHENGGSGEISVAGLSGLLADPQRAGSIATSGSAVAISTTPPTGAKQVLLTVDATNAAWARFAPTGNPFIDPPATPNAFDDEFIEGSNPDLATRGLIVKNAAGTTLTRSGPIAPWDGTGPAAGTYWSSIVGSFLFVQGPPNTTIWIFKSITLALGDSYYARMAYGGFAHNSSSTDKFTEVGFYANSGGLPDSNNRIYVSDYEINGAAHKLDIGRITATVFGGTSRDRYFDADIRGVRYRDASPTYDGIALNASSGEGVTQQLTGGIAAASVAYFAIGFKNAGSAGGVPNVGCVDFLRKKTGGAWFIP